ncbi:unnamed protein product [Camellia sinensis]
MSLSLSLSLSLLSVRWVVSEASWGSLFGRIGGEEKAHITDSNTMGKMRSFKQEFSFEERSEESRDMIAKYPDRVPVVVERYSNTDLPEIEKKKYLVPRDMSVGQFIHILSCRLRLAPGKALFASLMESVYKTFKEEDGFLYMCYSSEKTFGCGNSQTCGCTSL